MCLKTCILPFPDTLTWQSDIPAQTTYTLQFTAILTDSQAFAGQTITNTVQFSAQDHAPGQATATFTVEESTSMYRIYLPTIMRGG
ncbi:MAG: hypothetical protein JXA33_01740 [Anaerolineae bacterium]|nr:hypothetical protein [Anaerolineae bacterium]